MVNYVTKEIGILELYLVKKAFFINQSLSFILGRNSVQVSQYVMVSGVYPSHIDFKGIMPEPSR